MSEIIGVSFNKYRGYYEFTYKDGSKKQIVIDDIGIISEPEFEAIKTRVSSLELEILPQTILQKYAYIKPYMSTGHNTSNYTGANLLVMTDVHGSDTPTLNCMKIGNNYDMIDMIINLGDTAASNYYGSDGSWYRNIVLQSEKPMLTILGNHDVGNSKSKNASATTEEAFTKWIKQTGITAPYYSKTINDLSVIFLNNYDSPDNKDSDGNFIVYKGIECFSQEQIDWLLDTLADIPTTNTLVICMHSFPYANTISHTDGWSTFERDALTGSGGLCAYTDIIPDIVNAWKNGTSLTKTYQARQYFPEYVGDMTLLTDIDVDCDFSSRGVGKFACYIVGHTHRDSIATSDTYNDQIVINIASASYDYDQIAGTDLTRNLSDISSDCITDIDIDTYRGWIRLTRIGAHLTAYGQDRQFHAIKY